jgi:hypothetical protein
LSFELDRPISFDDGSVMLRAAACLLLALTASACSRPDPASTNEVLAPGDAWNRVVLDAPERAEAVAIIRGATADPHPEFPFPAPRGVRWSDVPDAAAAAAAKVEMAVVNAAQPGEPDWDSSFLAKPPASLVGDLADGRERWVFELKDLRDDRGWLVVGRTDATRTLVESFAEQLRTLGARPGFKAD